MRRVPATLVAALAATALLVGCVPRAATPNDPPSWSEETDDLGMPAAHPAFAAQFTDPIYEDPANEFAPFGTDEGSDMLFEWDERRDELTPDTTLAELLEMSGFAGILDDLRPAEGSGAIPEPGGPEDAATITQGAAFTQLRLTGAIDAEGRQRALYALEILIDVYDAPPELVLQREDLESWTG
jgi:uncharacterized protein YfeS